MRKKNTLYVDRCVCLQVSSWDENVLTSYLNISGPQPGMAEEGNLGFGRMAIWNSVVG